MSGLGSVWRKNGPELVAALRGGFPPFVGARNPQRPLGGIPVFCYHLVDPAVLEADLGFLRREGYETLRADAVLEVLAGRRPFTGREVVLTFDDGPVAVYREVFPLLGRFECAAVVFVCPGLHREAAEETWEAERPCTWEELGEMEASGWVDVQAHTLSHRSLVRWPEALGLTGIAEACAGPRRGEAGTVLEDLREAKAVLEGRLGKAVGHIAWPQYVAGAEAVAAAREAGYRGTWAGIRTDRAWLRPGEGAEEIPRISGEFLRRLPGAGRCRLAELLRDRYSTAFRKRLRGSP